MVTEVSEDLWKSSNITDALSVPGLKAGIIHKSEHLHIAVVVQLLMTIHPATTLL